jgi:hypothetical protein
LLACLFSFFLSFFWLWFCFWFHHRFASYPSLRSSCNLLATTYCTQSQTIIGVHSF